jgi:hypothetical protein
MHRCLLEALAAVPAAAALLLPQSVREVQGLVQVAVQVQLLQPQKLLLRLQLCCQSCHLQMQHYMAELSQQGCRVWPPTALFLAS